jgi:hypothetical protein
MWSSFRTRNARALLLCLARCRNHLIALFLRGDRVALPVHVSPPGPRARSAPRRATLLLAALAVAMPLAVTREAAAQCILVQERGGPQYAPHFVLHFGEPGDVPLHIACSTSLDKELPTLCVPIYAYNLWEGATAFEFALHTPVSPVGFDRSSAITNVEMSVTPELHGALTSLKLASNAPVCGPVLLGCLRLPTAGMPESFSITFGANQASNRCAAQEPDGEWRRAAVDGAGARVGTGLLCPVDGCGTHTPVSGLQATVGERANMIELSWTSGSGPYTLILSRLDGRDPADPWDGDFVALVPSSVTHFTHLASNAGQMRFAAWSVTRGPYGNYYAGSSIECGSLASILVQLPVGVEPRAWTQVKGLYR